MENYGDNTQIMTKDRRKRKNPDRAISGIQLVELLGEHVESADIAIKIF